MPAMKTPVIETLVIGAGELGQTVITGLLEQNPECTRSISVLLRPSSGSTRTDIARQLKQKGLQIVYADLSTETV